MSERVSTITLITEDGKEILIEFPESIFDEFSAKLERCLNEQYLFYPGTDWCGVQALFADKILDSINMKKVIGIQYG